MKKYILINASIIPMDDHRSIVQNGYLAIKNGIIDNIGSMRDFDESKYVEWDKVDYTGKVLLPGFINAHTHLPMSFFKGLCHQSTDLLYNIVFPMEKCLVAEDIYSLSLLSAIEALKSGVTYLNDMYYFMDEVAKALVDIGIKGLIGHAIASDYMPFAGEGELEKGLTLIKKWQNKHPRITPILTPHASDTVRNEWLREIKKISDTENIKIHLHLAQSATEVKRIRDKWNRTPVEYLHDNDFLGQNVLLAHCIYVNASDLRIICDSKSPVLFCPTSQALFDRVAPADQFISGGANVVIGTDAACSNDDMDMLEEIRMTVVTQSVLSGGSFKIDAHKALEMATIDAASALGISDKVGSLEVGKAADILVLAKESASMYPLYNLVSNIVYCGRSDMVRDVIIDGEYVLKDRKPLFVDELDVVSSAQRKAMAVCRRYGDVNPAFIEMFNKLIEGTLA